MILFQVDSVEMPEIDRTKIRKWLRAVAHSYGRVITDLCYRFCSDEVILDCNRQFLNHDYFTDIITFDYSEGNQISGDMLISLDTVASNAEQLGLSYSRELLRVLVHGVLHLCGLHDKEPGEREKMEYAENKALAIWDEME